MQDLTQQQSLQECSRLPRGSQWTDQRFPAESPTTLYVTGEPAGKTYNGGGKVQWLRPHEISGVTDASQIALIRDGAAAGDVIQGELGDCYFLSVLSVLAEKPDRIEALFNLEQMNDQGIFSVMMYKNGLK